MNELKPLFIPNSALDIARRMLTPATRLDASEKSRIGLIKLAKALQNGGAIMLDAHYKRPRIIKVPQMADIGFSVLHAYRNANPASIHLAAAGDFYFHPLVHPWITQYPQDGDQILKIHDVYSQKRELLPRSRCAHIDKSTMEQKNAVYHARMLDAIHTPNTLIVYNPFAGLNRPGEGTVPRRVANMLRQEVPVILSATWLGLRGYISGFSDSLTYFDANDSSEEIGNRLHIGFSEILQRIRS